MLVLALLTGTFVATTLDDAAQRQAAWGDTHVVAIAVRDLDPGHVVEPDDVRWVERPVGALPQDPEDTDPTGRLVVARVVAGETIPGVRLAPTGVRGLAGQVPARHVAVAVPTDARTPPLEPGQSVDLYTAGDGGGPSPDGGADAVPPFATGTPRGSDGDHTGALSAGPGTAPAPAARLARRALVIQVDDRQVTVAVADPEAAAVVHALISGTVLVALTGP